MVSYKVKGIRYMVCGLRCAAEVLAQAIIAKEIGYIKTEEFVHLAFQLKCERTKIFTGDSCLL
jgi:hypothetical protein